MKIKIITMICPKCREEFTNRSLMSFYSGMAGAANDFLKNNKKTTHCPKCNVNLVNEDYIDYFDEHGHFCISTKVINFNDSVDNSWREYNNIRRELSDIISSTQVKNIEFKGCLGIVFNESNNGGQEHKYDILNHIIAQITLKDGKKFDVFDLIIGKVDYSFGNAYRSFICDLFTRKNNYLRNFLKTATNSDFESKKVKITESFEFKLEPHLKKYSTK